MKSGLFTREEEEFVMETGKDIAMSNQKKPVQYVADIALLILGSFLTAFAFNHLIIPSGLLSGGVTGISQIVNHFSHVNMGILYFAFNVPLLWLGFRQLGKKFSLYTVIATGCLSFFLYIIPIRFIWTDDILLCALFGGLLSSVGTGLALRSGGSQGGLDIVSRIIAKHHEMPVGKINLLINVGIMILSGFIFGAEIALYTIISVFVGTKTYGVILNHVDRISVLIITEKGDLVCDAVTNQLHRGVTTWDAKGGFTHHEKTVLYCVIMKGELATLKRVVKEVDAHAFVTVISTQSVIGRFHQIW